ncbi:MAG: hypothetical protein NC228_06640, partial [[Eubacterium] siraeum]|nr:hypothetical protein [[Eubacterium] siraeum]
VGIDKKTLETVCVNLNNKAVFPVISHDISENTYFIEELIKVLSLSCETITIDADSVVRKRENRDENGFDELVSNIFDEMVERNNAYKDSKLNRSVLDKYEEKNYVVISLKSFYNRLSDDGKEKLSLLLEKAESIYKLHFIIMDSLPDWNDFNYDNWFKRQISGSDGLWIGNGFTDQYLLKVNKMTGDLYEEVGNEYGYLITRNRPARIKLLSSRELT